MFIRTRRPLSERVAIELRRRRLTHPLDELFEDELLRRCFHLIAVLEQLDGPVAWSSVRNWKSFAVGSELDGVTRDEVMAVLDRLHDDGLIVLASQENDRINPEAFMVRLAVGERIEVPVDDGAAGEGPEPAEQVVPAA